MKIVHIINNLKGGGMQNLLLSLAPSQVSKGNNVSVITLDYDNLEYSLKLQEALRMGGVNVLCLNRKLGSKLSTLNKIIHCINIVKKIDPDIINTHGELPHIFGAFSTISKKYRHVITIHNAPELWRKSCWLLNRKKPLIFCSLAASKYKHFKNKTTVTIPNGINPNIVLNTGNTSLRKEYDLPEDAKLIVLVGSLRKQKNYEFLVELAKTVIDRKYHFFICGGHYGNGYIDKKTIENISNVHYLGLRNDVAAIENECDCFLSCSTYEGLPMAVLEAFFVGIPCVLSPIVQHKDIAHDVYGCYIPTDFNVNDFVDSLEKAMCNNESKLNILQKREPQISKYSIEENSNAYINFYKTILGKK